MTETLEEKCQRLEHWETDAWAIRPDGWTYIDISGHYGGKYTVYLSKGAHGENVRANWCNTEELAELHAVIQAIDYERGRG